MRYLHRNTIIFIAVCALFHWATAQNNTQNAPEAAPTPAPAACPAPQAILGPDLYGEWTVELGSADAPASSPQQRGMVRFEQNPEFEDSIAGWFELGNSIVYVAGDIDEGQFSLEESDDGKRISAVWEGSIAEGSCGKTITGSRRVGETVSAFVLRKPNGWR